jgi:hypothetical protein
MLAVISKDLEASLQEAIDWVAAYAGVEAPVVALDRDYNADPVDAQTIDALARLFTADIIDQRTLLEVLRRGEVFGDDFDPEAIMERVMEGQLSGGYANTIDTDPADDTAAADTDPADDLPAPVVPAPAADPAA